MRFGKLYQLTIKPLIAVIRMIPLFERKFRQREARCYCYLLIVIC